MGPAAAIDAFADLVARAEASSSERPRAELARFQLRALSGTLAALADGGVPVDVDGALAVLDAHVASLGGDVDRDEGARLREKVAAYAVVADDLGLDREQLEDLVRRWDATDVTPRRSARSTASPKAAGGTPCPVCGEVFQRVGKHMSVAHRDEWERRRGQT